MRSGGGLIVDKLKTVIIAARKAEGMVAVGKASPVKEDPAGEVIAERAGGDGELLERLPVCGMGTGQDAALIAEDWNTGGVQVEDFHAIGPGEVSGYLEGVQRRVIGVAAVDRDDPRPSP
jgi:hypothetical protein